MEDYANASNDLKCPELNVLYIRQLRLEALDKEIENEKKQEKLLEKLQNRHELSKIQTRALLELVTEKIQSYTEFLNEASQSMTESQNLNIEIFNALEKERKENKEFYDEFYDNLCYCMLTNPKETFEMMLGQVERNKKLEDNSGQSWKWTFKFHFLARLRMALKLIFG